MPRGYQANAPPELPGPTGSGVKPAEEPVLGDADPSQTTPSATGQPAEPGSRETGGAASAAVAPVVVPRWIQLVTLPLLLLGLWALARAAGTVLLILVAASTFALVLSPLVRMIQRRRVPRGLAILLVYLGLLAALVGIGVLLANPVSTQVANFKNNLPSLVRQANHDLANVQTWLDHRGIKIHIEHQGQTALQTLEKNVSKDTGNIVSFARDLLGKLVTLTFDLVLVLVLSIYLLVYGRQIGALVRRIMPPGDGTPQDDFPLLVQRAVFGYVRGQLLFSLVMGSSAALCLWIIGTIGIFPAGADYALFFGAFYGVMELIPYLGPIVGAVPAVLVALFNDPISALWVTLLFVGLQQLEGHVVAPQVFRLSLRINPILIILSLLIGYQLYGIAGALVALPVAAVVRETILYLRRHLVLEPWGTPAAVAGSAPDEGGPEAVLARDERTRVADDGPRDGGGGQPAGDGTRDQDTPGQELPTEPEVPVGR